MIRVALADLLWPLEPARAAHAGRARRRADAVRDPAAHGCRRAVAPGPVHELARRPARGWRLRCRHAGAIASNLRRQTAWRVSRARRAHASMVHRNAAGAAVAADRARLRAARRARAVPADLGEPAADRGRARRRPRRVPQARAVRGAAALPRGQARRGAGPARRHPGDEARPAARAPPCASGGCWRSTRSASRSTSRPSCARSTTTRPTAPTTRRSCRSSRRRRPRASPSAGSRAPPRPRSRCATRASGSRACRRSRSASRSPTDPTLAYGTNLLVAAWRDLGLGAVVGGEDARLERLAAPYPRAGALTAAAKGRHLVPIAWVADARLVSPRLRGWREDELGNVDYGRIRFRGPSRSR